MLKSIARFIRDSFKKLKKETQITVSTVAKVPSDANFVLDVPKIDLKKMKAVIVVIIKICGIKILKIALH